MAALARTGAEEAGGGKAGGGDAGGGARVDGASLEVWRAAARGVAPGAAAYTQDGVAGYVRRLWSGPPKRVAVDPEALGLTSLDASAQAWGEEERSARMAMLTGTMDLDCFANAPGGFANTYPAHFSERYEVGSELGRGTYGVVYAGTDRATGGEVAIKVVAKDRGEGGMAQLPSRVKQEVTTMAQLAGPDAVRRCDECVRLLDVQEDAESVCIIMDRCAGSLSDTIASAETSERSARKIAAALLRFLVHVHEEGFIFRDLKPKNIMFADAPVVVEGPPASSGGSRGGAPMRAEAGRSGGRGGGGQRPPGARVVRVVDFGAACRADPGDGCAEGVAGSPQFMAPEMGSGRYDARSDVWSVGVILYQLLGGGQPVARHCWGELNALFEGRTARHGGSLPGSEGVADAEAEYAMEAAIRRALADVAALAADPDAAGTAFLDFEGPSWDFVTPRTQRFIRTLLAPVHARPTAAEALALLTTT